MVIKKPRLACLSCGAPLAGDVVHIGDQYPSAIFLQEHSDI